MPATRRLFAVPMERWLASVDAACLPYLFVGEGSPAERSWMKIQAQILP